MMENVSAEDLMAALANVLAENPELNKAFNSFISEELKKITPKDAKDKMIKILKGKNNKAKLAIYKNLLEMDVIDETDATKQNDELFNDPENADNSKLTTIKNGASSTNLEKTSKSVKEAKPILSQKLSEMLIEIVQSLTDDQLKALFNKCLADKDFLNAVEDLIDATKDMKTNMALLKKLNLSPAEMRDALYNGDNKFNVFAAGCNRISAK